MARMSERKVEDKEWTRREWLILETLAHGASSVMLAIEAVSTTALEHPEWDMDERKTWAEWVKT